MGHRFVSQDGSTSTLAALALAALATAMMGTMYYTLDRHDVVQANQLMQQALQAGEQQAVVASQAVAALGGGLVQTDLFRIQEMLATGFSREGLIAAVVIDQDNMIMAAKDQKEIGKQVQDSTWLSLRVQNREVVSRVQDQTGRTIVTIVEPMKDKNETIAWAKMIYAIPQPTETVRSSKDRLWETFRLVGPLTAFLLIGFFMVMRLAKAKMRKEIQALVSSAQREEGHANPGSRLRKAS